MNVKGIIVEQIDWDGTSKSLSMQPDFRLGDMWVAFPQDYEEPRNGPFYFQNPQYERQFNKNIAECNKRKLTAENFYFIDDIYTFKGYWHGLPAERNSLTYYALYLPEYAIPLSVDLYDPQDRSKQFKRTIIKDDQQPRYIIYLKCTSQFGVFNFNIECQFKEDKQNFLSSNYADEYQTKLYTNPDEWKRFLNEEDRGKTQQFFADQIVVNNGKINNITQNNNPTQSSKKWTRAHTLALCSLIVAIVVMVFGNNIWGRLFSGEEFVPSENISVKINDVYYYTDSSKHQTYPNAFKKDETGVLISGDDITQNETLRMLWIGKNPIIKFSLINTNYSKPIKILGVFLEINSKEYWLKISTQYDKDEPVICSPNSNNEYAGVPINYPIYKINEKKLYLENNPFMAQELYSLYVQTSEPIEINGRIAVMFEDSSLMVVNQPFRINKKSIKNLIPGPNL